MANGFTKIGISSDAITADASALKPLSKATSTTVSTGSTTASITCTTPLSVFKSTAETGAWFTKTPPAPVTVNFKVLVVDNGCAIKPFVTALDGTTEPKTW